MTQKQNHSTTQLFPTFFREIEIALEKKTLSILFHHLILTSAWCLTKLSPRFRVQIHLEKKFVTDLTIERS